MYQMQNFVQVLAIEGGVTGNTYKDYRKSSVPLTSRISDTPIDLPFRFLEEWNYYTIDWNLTKLRRALLRPKVVLVKLSCPMLMVLCFPTL